MDDFDQLPALMQSSNVADRQGDICALNRMREMLFVDVGTLDEITSQTVQEWASILFERVRAGSRALGDAIVASGEAADTGDFRSAALEMRRFVDLCDMPFYREIAMNRLCEYDAR